MHKGFEYLHRSALDTQNYNHAAQCRKSDQPDRPTQLNALPAGADREASDRPSGNAIRTNRTQTMIAVKRAIILLRFDWLMGLIGALLC
jgi:hypothetical protein